MDDEVDLLSGNRIDLEILEHIPNITSEPKAMEVIAELVAKLPEMERDGVMSGPGMFVNVQYVSRVVIAAPSGRPLFRRVCPCVRSFSESRGCTRFRL